MSLRSTSRRIGIVPNAAVLLVLVATASSCPSPQAVAQAPAPGESQKKLSGEQTAPTADRKRALALFYAHQHLDALPLLEELARTHPDDREVRESLAAALFTKSATVGAEEGQALRRRGRSILAELKNGGPISDLGVILLEGTPEDGRMPTFSEKSDAQAAMKEGEAAFARRDFDAARRSYKRAISLDPSLYHASLFMGDTYFAEGRLQDARTWFSRAILIDPNKETAHRYLADALNKAGLFAAARLSYIDAIIAEPYSRRPWMGLSNWARGNNVTLQHPRVVPEDLDAADAAKGAGPKVKPNDAGKADGRSQWRLYRQTRQAWAKDRFQKAFPGTPYRHSLPEETDALHRVAAAIAADVKAGRIKEPDPCFANLMKLDEEGLLDAYVLFARPDAGIAEDYPAYRDAHRVELRRYLRKYVAPLGNGVNDADEGK